jgi:xanthine dehydrogenase accessory factor
LIGAGPLTECLATMAYVLWIRCHGMRPARGIPGLLGLLTVSTMRTEMPDDVVLDMRPDRRTCVVALDA